MPRSTSRPPTPQGVRGTPSDGPDDSMTDAMTAPSGEIRHTQVRGITGESVGMTDMTGLFAIRYTCARATSTRHVRCVRGVARTYAIAQTCHIRHMRLNVQSYHILTYDTLGVPDPS